MAKMVDRVVETTTSPGGTGTINLAGAQTGYRAFSAALASGDKVFYCIEDDPSAPTVWEYGIGTWTDAATDTLSRDTILASSNGGAAVNLTNATTYTVTGTLTTRALFPTVLAKTAAYSVTASDIGALIDATSGTWTLSLPAAATAGDGFRIVARNSGTGVITIDPNGAETIDGASTTLLSESEACVIVCNGSAWKTIGLTRKVAASDGTVSLPSFTFASDPDTGFYRVASNSLGLTVGGVQLLRAEATLVTVNTFLRIHKAASSGTIATLDFSGLDDGAAQQQYASIDGVVVDPTAGGEDGKLDFKTTVAGTLDTRMSLAQGLLVGAATGGDKGGGTINVSADIYKNNTAFTNPDYVFEKHFTGRIERYKANPGAATYAGRLALAQIEAFARENHHLPGAHDQHGAFARADFLLEKLEEAYLHLFEMDARLKALEAKA